MEDNPSIGVIGSGSWATALVKMLQNNLDEIHWLVRSEEQKEHIQKYGHNPRYLPSADLEPDKLRMDTDIHRVIATSDILIMVVPSTYIYSVFREVDKQELEGKIIFSSVKGMVSEFDMVPAKFFHKRFDIPYKDLGIICGPCHAEEVAMERLSYLTVACKKKKKAEYLAEMLACRYIKTHVSDDVIGSEIATAMKNVFAIASGVAHGLGYGDNFQAVLVSNAIREMEEFLDEVKSIHRDVKSSAYLGDLLVTAYSNFSRNRNFGHMIGKGYNVRTAMMEMNMVAEGYYAVKSLIAMNEKYECEIPITKAVYRILYEKNAPKLEFYLLADKLT
ncbi:MAG: NAD(P)H-dependent glycerol-3-phosphate dehydrogenase [Flavobacteriales bacterium]|nr:NAD(P)H-dependent glycerol-3-phosphate dehydrogenase [Flavobacteriales bacterium]